MTERPVKQVGALNDKQRAELLKHSLVHLTVRDIIDLVKKLEKLEKDWDVEDSL